MIKQEPKTYEHEGEKICQCNGCEAKIFFKEMPSGRFMPISVETGTSHFIDCPARNDFRNRKKGPKQGRNVEFEQKGKP